MDANEQQKSDSGGKQQEVVHQDSILEQASDGEASDGGYHGQVSSESSKEEETKPKHNASNQGPSGRRKHRKAPTESRSSSGDNKDKKKKSTSLPGYYKSKKTGSDSASPTLKLKTDLAQTKSVKRSGRSSSSDRLHKLEERREKRLQLSSSSDEEIDKQQPVRLRRDRGRPRNATRPFSADFSRVDIRSYAPKEKTGGSSWIEPHEQKLMAQSLGQLAARSHSDRHINRGMNGHFQPGDVGVQPQTITHYEPVVIELRGPEEQPVVYTTYPTESTVSSNQVAKHHSKSLTDVNRPEQKVSHHLGYHQYQQPSSLPMDALPNSQPYTSSGTSYLSQRKAVASALQGYPEINNYAPNTQTNFRSQGNYYVPEQQDRGRQQGRQPPPPPPKRSSSQNRYAQYFDHNGVAVYSDVVPQEPGPIDTSAFDQLCSDLGLNNQADIGKNKVYSYTDDKDPRFAKYGSGAGNPNKSEGQGNPGHGNPGYGGSNPGHGNPGYGGSNPGHGNPGHGHSYNASDNHKSDNPGHSNPGSNPGNPGGRLPWMGRTTGQSDVKSKMEQIIQKQTPGQGTKTSFPWKFGKSEKTSDSDTSHRSGSRLVTDANLSVPSRSDKSGSDSQFKATGVKPFSGSDRDINKSDVKGTSESESSLAGGSKFLSDRHKKTSGEASVHAQSSLQAKTAANPVSSSPVKSSPSPLAAESPGSTVRVVAPRPRVVGPGPNAVKPKDSSSGQIREEPTKDTGPGTSVVKPLTDVKQQKQFPERPRLVQSKSFEKLDTADVQSKPKVKGPGPSSQASSVMPSSEVAKTSSETVRAQPLATNQTYSGLSDSQKTTMVQKPTTDPGKMPALDQKQLPETWSSKQKSTSQHGSESFETHKSKLDTAISQLEDLYEKLNQDEQELSESNAPVRPQPRTKPSFMHQYEPQEPSPLMRSKSSPNIKSSAASISQYSYAKSPLDIKEQKYMPDSAVQQPPYSWYRRQEPAVPLSAYEQRAPQSKPYLPENKVLPSTQVYAPDARAQSAPTYEQMAAQVRRASAGSHPEVRYVPPHQVSDQYAPHVDMIGDDMAVRNLRRELWGPSIMSARPQSTGYLLRDENVDPMSSSAYCKTDDDLPVRKQNKKRVVRRSLSGNIADLVKQFSKSDSEAKDDANYLKVNRPLEEPKSPQTKTRTPRSVKQKSEQKRQGRFDNDSEYRYPSSDVPRGDYDNLPGPEPGWRSAPTSPSPGVIHAPVFSKVIAPEHGLVVDKSPYAPEQRFHSPVYARSSNVVERKPVYGRVQGSSVQQPVIVTEPTPTPPPRLKLDMRRAALMHEPPTVTSPRGSPMSDKELDDLLSNLNQQTEELEAAEAAILVSETVPALPSSRLKVLPVTGHEGRRTQQQQPQGDQIQHGCSSTDARPSFLQSVLGGNKSPSPSFGGKRETVEDVLARYPVHSATLSAYTEPPTTEFAPVTRFYPTKPDAKRQHKYGAARSKTTDISSLSGIQPEYDDGSTIKATAGKFEQIIASHEDGDKRRPVWAKDAYRQKGVRERVERAREAFGSDSDKQSSLHPETKAERMARFKEERRKQLTARAEEKALSSDSDQDNKERPSYPRRRHKKEGLTQSTERLAVPRHEASADSSDASSARQGGIPLVATVPVGQPTKTFVEYVDTSLTPQTTPVMRRARKEGPDAEKIQKDKSAKRKSALNASDQPDTILSSSTLDSFAQAGEGSQEEGRRRFRRRIRSAENSDADGSGYTLVPTQQTVDSFTSSKNSEIPSTGKVIGEPVEGDPTKDMGCVLRKFCKKSSTKKDAQKQENTQLEIEGKEAKKEDISKQKVKNEATDVANESVGKKLREKKTPIDVSTFPSSGKHEVAGSLEKLVDKELVQESVEKESVKQSFARTSLDSPIKLSDTKQSKDAKFGVPWRKSTPTAAVNEEVAKLPGEIVKPSDDKKADQNTLKVIEPTGNDIVVVQEKTYSASQRPVQRIKSEKPSDVNDHTKEQLTDKKDKAKSAPEEDMRTLLNEKIEKPEKTLQKQPDKSVFTKTVKSEEKPKPLSWSEKAKVAHEALKKNVANKSKETQGINVKEGTKSITSEKALSSSKQTSVEKEPSNLSTEKDAEGETTSQQQTSFSKAPSHR